MRKKGISNIIAIVSIILTVVLGVATLWVYLNMFLKNLEFSPELDCLDLQTKNVLTIKNACYTEDKVEIMIERSLTDTDIKKFNFVVYGSNIKNYACGNVCGDCLILGAGETKKYFLEKPEGDLGRVALYSGSCFLDEIILREC